MSVLSGVVSESSTGLSAEMTGSNEPPQGWMGNHTGVAKFSVQGLEDAEGGVETDEVEKFEGTEWKSASSLHCGVDVVDRCGSSFGQRDGCIEMGEEQGIDDETGSIGNLDDLAAAVR